MLKAKEQEKKYRSIIIINFFLNCTNIFQKERDKAKQQQQELKAQQTPKMKAKNRVKQSNMYKTKHAVQNQSQRNISRIICLWMEHKIQ